MAYKMVNKDWCDTQLMTRVDFIMDTDADAKDLPESCTGSMALSVESGKMFMVNASGNWVVFGGK